METSTIVHQRVPLLSRRVGRNLTHFPRKASVVVGIMSNPKANAVEITGTTVYNDNYFDRLAISYLSKAVQASSGLRSDKSGYESLIEVTAMVSKSFSLPKQQEIISNALEKAFPKPILSLIRMLLPPSKFTREFFAIFTTFFFPWLVGPCEVVIFSIGSSTQPSSASKIQQFEAKIASNHASHSFLRVLLSVKTHSVRESELDGRKEKSVVHIKKCRFLETTNCVGMCTNLCKVPSQKFIMDSFGIPVNMVPNFEDMSCQMIFGQHPLPAMDDPAFKQPCYQTLCKAKQKHQMDCSS